jgi:hypothetical protein
MQPMAALHMREHIKPGVSLPEEDIIVLHLLSLSLWHESIYSFDNALQRLSAASQDLFNDAVRLESIFLRYEPKVVSSDSCTYTGLGTR